MRLRFPHLTEVMGADQHETENDTDSVSALTPEGSPAPEHLWCEEMREIERQALMSKETDEFHTVLRETNAARIYMPNDDETYLNGLWEQLSQTKSRHCRILYYGDSQIECDRITSVLRQRFQEEFGGMGVGLVPALQSIPTFTLSSTIIPEDVPQYLAYGPSEKRSEDNFYGPLARVTHIPDGATIQLSGIGADDYSLSRRCTRLTVITRHTATLLLTTGKDEASADTLRLMLSKSKTATEHLESEEPCFYVSTLSHSTSKMTLRVEGEADILGIQLDGTTGVNIDNIPMRGSSGRELMSISPSSMLPFFSREHVVLIILQFGGNSTPYLNQSNLSDFKNEMKRLINHFHRLSPQSKILFIGPADMAHSREDGRLESYPILPALTDSLRSAANESEAAYWDMYAAMGGRGSIMRWVEARPQLDGEDYIHFTTAGAKRIGEMLYETLQFYHKFWEKENP